MTLKVACSIIAAVLWIIFLWSRRKYYAFALKMPGPIGLPLIGIVYKLYNVEELLYTLPRIAAEYKTKSMFSWFGPYPIIYTIEPKVAEIVLNSPDCINKPMIYNVFNDVIGVGLFNTPMWNARRRLLNPSFNHKALVNFFPTFNKFSREICKELRQVAGYGKVDIKQITFAFALKSAVATTMGHDLTNSMDSSFVKDAARILEGIIDLVLKPWLRISFIFERWQVHKGFTESLNNLKSFARELVLYKIKLSKEKDLAEIYKQSNTIPESMNIEKIQANFIDQAIKNYQKNELTSEDIITESSLILFAGTETTSTSLFSALLYLAMHPDYQEKAFSEIISVFSETEFEVSYEDLKNLPFISMCVNETLRIAPAAPVIGRVCTKDVPISKDVVIPKGTQIFVDIFNIQRDADIWGPNANIFDPDHFLPTNVGNRHAYSFLPFSKGPRICLGWQYSTMILKVALVHILRKYRLSSDFQYKDLHYLENVTLQYKILPHLEVLER